MILYAKSNISVQVSFFFLYKPPNILQYYNREVGVKRKKKAHKKQNKQVKQVLFKQSLNVLPSFPVR